MGSPLKNYPISGTWSTRAYDRLLNRRELRLAMEGKITFISPQDFLNEFVPKAKQRLPAKFATLLGKVPTGGTERVMYEPLMDALNDKDAKLCPEFTFVATPSRGDKSAEHKQAVDCGMYPSKFIPPPGVSDSGDPTTPAVDWSRIQVSIEVKPNQTQDPFFQWSITGKPSSLERKQILGQILDYAKSVFDHQHRMFQYMVFIAGEDARILRIDRSGVFVTDAIKYKTNGLPLLEFFWRFARLTDEGRGEDPTAERVPHDSNAARDIRCRSRDAQEGYVSDLFKASLDNKWPWWILTVKDEHTGAKRRFFVGKPHFKSPGLAGRGTRGYVALDFDDENAPFVYLKDCWRVVHDEIQKEGLVLETLNANRVPHVPTVACHGDLGQRAKSYDLWYKYHPEVSRDDPCPLKSHEHYRLVVKEVGKPLKEFRSGHELVFAIFCCLKAHWVAYNLGIIHRDISAGNILLYPDAKGVWTGLLNDWELSKDVHSKSPVGRQPDRTGTWQFLSAHALNHSEKPIVIPDELESFFHVLLYMAIRFLPHNCAKEYVGKLLYEYFDDYQYTTKGYGCGEKKLSTMRTGNITFTEDFVGIDLYFYFSHEDSETLHPIDKLIRALLDYFKSYYAVQYPQGKAAAADPGSPTTSDPDEYEDYLESLPSSDPPAPVESPEPAHVESPEPAPVESSKQPLTTRGTEKDQRVAKLLESHHAVAHLFKDFLNRKKHKWPGPEDKGVDKKPKEGYKPGDEMPRDPTQYMSFKRAAEDVEELEPPSTPKRFKAAEDEEPMTPLAGSPSPGVSQ